MKKILFVLLLLYSIHKYNLCELYTTLYSYTKCTQHVQIPSFSCTIVCHPITTYMLIDRWCDLIDLLFKLVTHIAVSIYYVCSLCRGEVTDIITNL